MHNRIRGFTLVEIMIAMAVASLLGLAVMTMVNNMSRGTRNVQEQTEITEIWNGIQLLLSNNQACINNLYVGLGVNNTNRNNNAPIQINTSNGSTTFYTSVNNVPFVNGAQAAPVTTLWNVGTTAGNYSGNSVTITKWWISIPEATPTGTAQGANFIIIPDATLNITFQSINSLSTNPLKSATQSLGAQTVTKTIPLTLSVTNTAPYTINAVSAANALAACQTSASSNYWTQTSTTSINPNSTYSSVGIGGMNPPDATLEVESGSFHVAGTSQLDGTVTAGSTLAVTGKVTASADVAIVGTAGSTTNLLIGTTTTGAYFGGSSNPGAAIGSTFVVDQQGNNTGVNPGSAAFFTGGSIAGGSHYGNSFYYSSDRRLKRDIKDLDGLAFIEQIQGHSFFWKKSGKHDYGVIAQEVEKIAPELVTAGTDGIKFVKYDSFVAPLIEAVKQQQAEIKALQAEVEKLKAKR